MPKRLIDQLSLRPFRRRRAHTTASERDVQIYGTVRLTVQGRECHVDVSEIAEKCPVLIGQVPLELLDFVIDQAGCGEITATMDDAMHRSLYRGEPMRLQKSAEQGLGFSSEKIITRVHHFLQHATATGKCRQTNRRTAGVYRQNRHCYGEDAGLTTSTSQTFS